MTDVGELRNSAQSSQSSNYNIKRFSNNIKVVGGIKKVTVLDASTESFKLDRDVLEGTVEYINNISYSMDSTFTTNVTYGVRIYTTISTKLYQVIKNSLCTGTKCSLYTDSGTLIKTIDFVGDIAILDYSVTINTYYRILIHNDGSAYTGIQTSMITLPINNTSLNYVSGAYYITNNQSSTLYNIYNITTTDDNISDVSPLMDESINDLPISDEMIYCDNNTFIDCLTTEENWTQ